jgi:N4-gp56 family major capsid protein
MAPFTADNTTTTLSNTLSIYYDKVFLERYKALLRFGIGAYMRKIPANSGKTIIFNRMAVPTLAVTPLTEGVTPTSLSLSTTQVTATIGIYGAYTQTSEFYEETSIDAGLKEQAEVMAQHGAETVNQVIRKVMTSFLTVPGSTIQRAGGAANDGAILNNGSFVLTGTEIKRAVRTLKLNKAPVFEDNMYKSIIPVEAAYDLRGSTDWVSANTYVNADNWKNGKIGWLHGVMFYETNDSTVSAGGTVTATNNFAAIGTATNAALSITTGPTVANVHETFVFGRQAYGITEIEGADAGKEPIVIYKKSNANDTSNPLNLYSTIGWKAKFAAVMLNSLWSIAIRSAVSA